MLLLLPSLLGRRRKIPEIMKPFRFPVRHPVICTVVWILVFISSFFILGKLGFQMDIRRFDGILRNVLELGLPYVQKQALFGDPQSKSGKRRKREDPNYD